MTRRCLLYGRASRDPKAAGTSVTKQLERGRAYAATEQLTVVAEIRDDNRSASRGSHQRPGFVEVHRLVNQRAADVLVLWEVSRSSRDLEEFMGLVNACADNGLEIAVSGVRYDPAKVDDWLPLVFQGVMAEAEARRIKQRNIDSVETNALRGTPHGRIPYGFRRVYNPHTGVLVEQTPFGETDPTELLAEARVLAEAANAVVKGVTLRQICRDLNSRGVPTPRRPRKATVADNPSGVVRVWEPSTLRQLLLNPTIAGRRIHRGQDIGPAAWPAILDYGVWLRMRDVLTDPGRLTVPVPRGPAPRHLLSGIAKCGVCGARLKAATNLSRLPRAYVCRAEGCMKVTVSANPVDKHIEQVLHAYFERPGFVDALADAERRRLAAEANHADTGLMIRQLENELRAVEQLRESGELTLRAYAAETRRLESKAQELRSQRTAAIESPALRRLVSAPSIRDAWDKAELPERREIIKLLFDVRVNRASKRGRVFDCNRIVIKPSEALRA